MVQSIVFVFVVTMFVLSFRGILTDIRERQKELALLEYKQQARLAAKRQALLMILGDSL